MKNKKSLGQIAFERVMISPWGIETGRTKTLWESAAKAVEREVKKRSNNGWIHVSERRPTKMDCDRYGQVLVWGGRCVVWCGFKAIEDYGWWQPCPKAPKKIGSYNAGTLVINKAK